MAAVQNTELFIPNEASIQTLPLRSLPRSITKKILTSHPQPAGPATLICPVELRVRGATPKPPPLHPGQFSFPIVTSKVETHQLLQSFLTSGELSVQLSALTAGGGTVGSDSRNSIILFNGQIYLSIRNHKQPSAQECEAPPTNSPVPQVGGGIRDVIEGRRREGRAEDHGKRAEGAEDGPQTPMKDASTNTFGVKIKEELFAECEWGSEWRDASTGERERYANTDIGRSGNSAVMSVKGHVNRTNLQGSAREGNVTVLEAEGGFRAKNKERKRRISGNALVEMNVDSKTEVQSGSVKLKRFKNDAQVCNVEAYESDQKALSDKLNSNFASTESCFMGECGKTSVSSEVLRSFYKNDRRIFDMDKSLVGTLSSDSLGVDDDDRVSDKITDDANQVGSNVENLQVRGPSVEGERCEGVEIVGLTDDRGFVNNIATEKANSDVIEVKSCVKLLASEVKKSLTKRDSGRYETNSDVAESESRFKPLNVESYVEAENSKVRSSSEVEGCEDVEIVKVYNQQKLNLDVTKAKSYVKPHAYEIQRSVINAERFTSDTANVNTDNNPLKGRKSNADIFHVSNDDQVSHKTTYVKKPSVVNIESDVEAENSEVLSSSEMEDVEIVEVSDDQDNGATERTNSDATDGEHCNKPHASKIQGFRSDTEIVNNDNSQTESHVKRSSAKVRNSHAEICNVTIDDEVLCKSTYAKNQIALNVKRYVEAENSEVRRVERSEAVEIVEVSDDQRKTNSDEVGSCIKARTSESRSSLAGSDFLNSDTECQISMSKMKCRQRLCFDDVTDKLSEIKFKNVTREDWVNSKSSNTDVVGTSRTSSDKSSADVIEIEDNDGDDETRGNADKTIKSAKSCLSDANTQRLAAKANRVSFKSSVDVVVIDGSDWALRESPNDASRELANDENSLAEVEIVNVDKLLVENESAQITDGANSSVKANRSKRKICDSSTDGACPDVVDVKSYVGSASEKHLKYGNDTNSDGTNLENCGKSHVNILPSAQVDNVNLNSYAGKSSLATNTNAQNTKRFGDRITGADETNSYVTDVDRSARSQIGEVGSLYVNFERCSRIAGDVNVVTDGNEGGVSHTVKTTQIIVHDEQEAISDFTKSKNVKSFSTSVENTEVVCLAPKAIVKTPEAYANDQTLRKRTVEKVKSSKDVTEARQPISDLTNYKFCDNTSSSRVESLTFETRKKILKDGEDHSLRESASDLSQDVQEVTSKKSDDVTEKCNNLTNINSGANVQKTHTESSDHGDGGRILRKSADANFDVSGLLRSAVKSGKSDDVVAVRNVREESSSHSVNVERCADERRILRKCTDGTNQRARDNREASISDRVNAERRVNAANSDVESPLAENDVDVMEDHDDDGRVLLKSTETLSDKLTPKPNASADVASPETANQSPSRQEVGVSSSSTPSAVNCGFDYETLIQEERIALLREKLRGLEDKLDIVKKYDKQQ